MKTKIAVVAIVVLANIFGAVNVSAGVGITVYKLAHEEMVSPVLFHDKQGITYVGDEGLLKQRSLSITGNTISLGTEQSLSVSPADNVSEVVWPEAGNNFIAKSSGRFKVYNAATNQYSDLPEEIMAVAWLPSGNEFLYAHFDMNALTTTIYRSTVGGSGTIVRPFGTPVFVDQLKVSPTGTEFAASTIAYTVVNGDVSEPITYALTVYPMDGGQVKTIASVEAAYGMNWNKSGSKLLYWTDPIIGTPGITYSLYDNVAGTSRILATSSSTAATGAVWSKDETNFYTVESLYDYDSYSSIQKRSIADPNTGGTFQIGNADIRPIHLFVGEQNEVVYFIDAYTNALYFADLSNTHVGGVLPVPPANPYDPVEGLPYPTEDISPANPGDPTGSITTADVYKFEGDNNVYALLADILYPFENYQIYKYYLRISGKKLINQARPAGNWYPSTVIAGKALSLPDHGYYYQCYPQRFDELEGGILVNDNGTIFLIMGCKKIPFNNFNAFKGLGYSLKNVVKKDLSRYNLVQTGGISSSDVAHTWGTWVSYKGTIYYSHLVGMIPAPSMTVFQSNGGKLANVVPANKYDIEIIEHNTNSHIMTERDPFVAYTEVLSYE